jgi:hypothetical protein
VRVPRVRDLGQDLPVLDRGEVLGLFLLPTERHDLLGVFLPKERLHRDLETVPGFVEPDHVVVGGVAMDEARWVIGSTGRGRSWDS